MKFLSIAAFVNFAIILCIFLAFGEDLAVVRGVLAVLIPVTFGLAVVFVIVIGIKLFGERRK